MSCSWSASSSASCLISSRVREWEEGRMLPAPPRPERVTWRPCQLSSASDGTRTHMLVGVWVRRQLTAAFSTGYEIVVGDGVGYEVASAAAACGHLAGGHQRACGRRGRTTWPGWRPRSSARDMVAGGVSGEATGGCKRDVMRWQRDGAADNPPPPRLSLDSREQRIRRRTLIGQPSPYLSPLPSSLQQADTFRPAPSPFGLFIHLQE